MARASHELAYIMSIIQEAALGTKCQALVASTVDALQKRAKNPKT
jgi:hypothetical protein